MSEQACERTGLPRGGVYVLVVRVAAARRLRVGRLGRRSFAPGWYCYVGSAQRGLGARLQRHARRRKARHWHIDWLTVVGEVVAAWVMEAERSAECRMAAALAHRGEVVSGFGDSDCRCGGTWCVLRRSGRPTARCWQAGVAAGGGRCGGPPRGRRAKNFGKKG